MSDRELRALERGRDATPEDLRRLVREGVLSEEQLRLAALLDCEPALELARGGLEPWRPPALLCDWAFEVAALGDEVAIRLAFAAVRHLSERWRWIEPELVSPVIETSARSYLDPTIPKREACRDAARALWSSIVRHVGDPELGMVLTPNERSRPATAIAAIATLIEARRSDCTQAIVRLVTTVEETTGDEHALRAAIGAELLPWALGGRDPLAASSHEDAVT